MLLLTQPSLPAEKVESTAARLSGSGQGRGRVPTISSSAINHDEGAAAAEQKRGWYQAAAERCAAAAERKRGWLYAAAENERSPGGVQQPTTARARQRRSRSAFRPKQRRQQCPNSPQPRRSGSGGAEARSTDRQRRSGSKCILSRGVSRPVERGPRSRLQQSAGTGRRWRGRRRRSGGGAAERRAKQGAARRGPTQPIKLHLIRSSCKGMKSAHRTLRRAVVR